MGPGKSTAWPGRCGSVSPNMRHPVFTPEHEELRGCGAALRRHRGAAPRRGVGASRALSRRALPPLRRARLPRPPLSGPLGRERRRPGGRASCSSRSWRAAARARSRWRSRCSPTWPRPRSPSSAPTTSASAGSGPRSPARRSARSRSPNPTRAPTSRRSVPTPCATATCGASTARKMFITNGARAALPHAGRQDRRRRRASRRLAVHRRHDAAGRVGVAAAREARHARVGHGRDRARRRRRSPRPTSSASNRDAGSSS